MTASDVVGPGRPDASDPRRRRRETRDEDLGSTELAAGRIVDPPLLRRHGWATTRWHLFTGDAVWHLDWPGPSLETACGYRTGALSPLWTLNIAFGEPAAPCRRCLRARVAGREDPGAASLRPFDLEQLPVGRAGRLALARPGLLAGP